jgi:hypothetical protein
MLAYSFDGILRGTSNDGLRHGLATSEELRNMSLPLVNAMQSQIHILEEKLQKATHYQETEAVDESRSLALGRFMKREGVNKL